ncbi:MAG: 5-formyltetrahydrofolate cyclo-ligase [Candidatus Bathyarchaeia archaeon]
MCCGGKREIRERIWRLMDDKHVSRFPFPIEGRTPNFEGADIAAGRLLDVNPFLEAEVVKVNPDYAQVDVRRNVLKTRKTLIMPTPRLKAGFLVLEPDKIPEGQVNYAATIKGSNRYGEKLEITKLPEVDLIVCGSVAITKNGRRIGKGGGYSDLEFAILLEAGLIEEEIPIATTIHELQLVKDAPVDTHDFTVDIISTPKRVIATSGPVQRPRGIIWEKLGEERLENIPILKKI